MIFTVGVTGLMMTLFAMDTNPKARGRSVEKRSQATIRGRIVFLTREEAEEAAVVFGEAWMRERGLRSIGELQRWIVMGVDASFDHHCFHESPDVRFPNARELKFDRPLLELGEQLAA